MSRAGFSEVVLPSAKINEISYRENIDNQRFSKGPGLVTFEPVTLRRGVTYQESKIGNSSSFKNHEANRDLYSWYKQVNNDSLLFGVAQELARGSIKPPKQNENFRKEVIIVAHNRRGEPVKQWVLFNAFPIAYKGGDDFDASADQQKLIEEITLTYEFFVELGGDIVKGFAKEFARDALEATVDVISEAVHQFTSGANVPPFLR